MCPRNARVPFPSRTTPAARHLNSHARRGTVWRLASLNVMEDQSMLLDIVTAVIDVVCGLLG